MIVTCIYVNVKPENLQGFVDAIVENHKGTVMEPGNLRFDVLQQADNPCRFMIYEVFESEEAVAAHKETAHYLRWRDKAAEWMAEPRRGIRYNILEPSDRSEW
jgi:autoinducer 2-degrading protein